MPQPLVVSRASFLAGVAMSCRLPAYRHFRVCRQADQPSLVLWLRRHRLSHPGVFMGARQPSLLALHFVLQVLWHEEAGALEPQEPLMLRGTALYGACKSILIRLQTQATAKYLHKQKRGQQQALVAERDPPQQTDLRPEIAGISSGWRMPTDRTSDQIMSCTA